MIRREVTSGQFHTFSSFSRRGCLFVMLVAVFWLNPSSIARVPDLAHFQKRIKDIANEQQGWIKKANKVFSDSNASLSELETLQGNLKTLEAHYHAFQDMVSSEQSAVLADAKLAEKKEEITRDLKAIQERQAKEIRETEDRLEEKLRQAAKSPPPSAPSPVQPATNPAPPSSSETRGVAGSDNEDQRKVQGELTKVQKDIRALQEQIGDKSRGGDTFPVLISLCALALSVAAWVWAFRGKKPKDAPDRMTRIQVDRLIEDAKRQTQEDAGRLVEERIRAAMKNYSEGSNEWQAGTQKQFLALQARIEKLEREPSSGHVLGGTVEESPELLIVSRGVFPVSPSDALASLTGRQTPVELSPMGFMEAKDGKLVVIEWDGGDAIIPSQDECPSESFFGKFISKYFECEPQGARSGRIIVIAPAKVEKKGDVWKLEPVTKGKLRLD